MSAEYAGPARPSRAGVVGWRAIGLAAAVLFGASAAYAAAAVSSAAPHGAAIAPPPGATASRASIEQSAFVDSLERNTFDWFWDFTGMDSVLTPDREPSRTFCSIAAVGFALTAYPIGAERGYVTRAAAARRTLTTLEYLWHARQDSSVSQSSGYRGFYYHFLDSRRGTRYKDVELSTIDTALLMAGVLFCGGYFDRRDALESRIRAVAESLYARVDWAWTQTRAPKLCMGWSPEGGFLPYDWRGYDEAMLLHVLALGSTTHPAHGEVWSSWASGYRWGTFQGQEHLGFAPLFGHQFSHAWIDFRGIQDDFMRAHGLDYFENSRRATLAQRAYAIANPDRFRGYGARLWGLTACDGPIDTTIQIEGVRRVFHTYTARGASFVRIGDDGTVAPCAAAGSIAFAPEIVLPVLRAMRDDYGANVYDAHGFVDALNPTLDYAPRISAGRIVPGVGWFDTDRLGIDQGPILAMIENWRSGLVWRVMRNNPHVICGLKRAGFRGAWLDHAPQAN